MTKISLISREELQKRKDKEQADLSLQPSFPNKFCIDATKIESLEDVKIIFSVMNLQINENCKGEDYDKIKHLLYDN